MLEAEGLSPARDTQDTIVMTARILKGVHRTGKVWLNGHSSLPIGCTPTRTQPARCSCQHLGTESTDLSPSRHRHMSSHVQRSPVPRI